MESRVVPMRRVGPSAGPLPFPLTCWLPYLQAAEILIALKKLGEKLKPSEEAFLAQNKTASMADFEAVGEGGDVGEAALRAVTK